MAKFYQDIIKAYFDNVPAAPTLRNHSMGNDWQPCRLILRAGEPIGLWTSGYNRKHTYGGFANGLAGKVPFIIKLINQIIHIRDIRNYCVLLFFFLLEFISRTIQCLKFWFEKILKHETLMFNKKFWTHNGMIKIT